MLHAERMDRLSFRRALVVGVALVVAFGVVVPAVSVAQTANDRYEPNDTQSSAASISAGSYSDLYINDGESDYFAISLGSGDSLSTSIDFDHSTGDLDLAVYGPDGNELSSSVSVTDGESVS